MVIINISFSFSKGGAAIAAHRFREILFSKYNTSQVISIDQKNAYSSQVLKRVISSLVLKIQFDGNPIKHSLNLFSYKPILDSIRCQNNALFHFHWFNNDTLSIFDLKKIPQGSILTLHDEWIYCGAEHCYKINDANLDFISGYSFFKKGVFGLHLNYIVWKIKLKHLSNRKDLIYTVPSQWMLDRAKKSMILRLADVRLLPNPINTSVFTRSLNLDCDNFRNSLMLLEDDFVFLFNSVKKSARKLKGIDILEKSLIILEKSLPLHISQKIKVIDFGAESKNTSDSHGFERTSLGHINSLSKLALLYSSVDCVIVPSLVESFGQVAAEALSCETPVVCFNSSGLKDIVINNTSGLQSDVFCSESLAIKLKEIIFMSSKERKILGLNGRKHIVNNFSIPVVSSQYFDILRDAQAIRFGYEP